MDSVSYLLSRVQHFSSLKETSQNRNRESGEEVDDNVKHSHCDQPGLVTGFSFPMPPLPACPSLSLLVSIPSCPLSLSPCLLSPSLSALCCRSLSPSVYTPRLDLSPSLSFSLPPFPLPLPLLSIFPSHSLSTLPPFVSRSPTSPQGGKSIDV